jgi:hypothetical protein
MILTRELKVRGMRKRFRMSCGGSAVIDMCGLWDVVQDCDSGYSPLD